MKPLPNPLARLRWRTEAPAPPAPTRPPARVYTLGPRHDWPAQAERRLTYRLFNYWDAQRGDKPYPAFAEIKGAAIPELWPWCFVLSAKRNYPTPYFHYLGKDLAKYSCIYLSGEDDWQMTLLAKAATHLDRTLTAREPVLVEDELIRFDHRHIVFRSIMLPLSDSGDAITHVLGAANGRLKKSDIPSEG